MTKETAAEFTNNVNHYLKLYEAGKITRVELHSRLLDSVEPDTVQEFVRLVPADILEEIERYVFEAPKTDEEWQSARFFHIGGICGRGPLEGDREGIGIGHPAIQRLRKEVETLRLYFQSRQ